LPLRAGKTRQALLDAAAANISPSCAKPKNARQPIARPASFDEVGISAARHVGCILLL
jgi:hypothetical protein